MGYRNHVGEKQSCNTGTSIRDIDDTAHCVLKGGSDRNIHQMFLFSISAQMNPMLPQLFCHLAALLNSIDEQDHIFYIFEIL